MVWGSLLCFGAWLVDGVSDEICDTHVRRFVSGLHSLFGAGWISAHMHLLYVRLTIKSLLTHHMASAV